MEGFCRSCLQQYSQPTDLLQYTERNRRLFVYCTGIQVKRNDTFTFQLCKECFFNMKQSCKFKKQCRTSDKLFKNYMAVKESGDPVSFGSFIKNMDGNFALRLPLDPSHSTPAHQQDDDNESTCTSFRNFITDIIDCEEMPPTDARIIREVIEEEADILDDSLDSHWLQEDNLSIATDFMDYGFSPFATPRSVRIDNCYTPRRFEATKEREIPNKSIKLEETRISNFDMPILDMGSNIDFETNIHVEKVETDYTEPNIDGLNDKSNEMTHLHELNNSIPSEVEDMVTENCISSKLQCFQTDVFTVNMQKDQNPDLVNLDDNAKDSESAPTSDICVEARNGKEKSCDNDDVPVESELEHYISQANQKKRKSKACVQSSGKKKAKGTRCTIDRNLEIALENKGKQEFPLDKLLDSPAVSIESGASTPTIKSILFGGNNDADTVANSFASMPLLQNIFEENINMENTPKYFPKVGQFIEEIDENITVKIEEIVNDSEVKELDKPMLFKDFLRYEEDTEFEGINDVKIENICDDDIKIEPCKVESESEIEPSAVLEEFLKRAESSPMKDNVLNEELLDQNMDLLNEKDENVFKRPRTPPQLMYDLDNFICKICDKSFKSSKAVKIHFCKIHKHKIPTTDPHRNRSQNDKFFLCVACGSNIKGASNYSRHKKTHENGVYQCEHCKEFFKNRPSMILHMKIHFRNKKEKVKHVCPTCGKNHSTLTNLKLHQRRHSKQFSVKCKYCGLGFYRGYDLKMHMSKHTGVRPFQCEYCSKAYTRSNALLSHLRRHLGALKHKCQICNEEFVSKTILKAHYNSLTCQNITQSFKKQTDGSVVTEISFRGSTEACKELMEQNILQKDKDSDIRDTEKVSENSERIIENNVDPLELNTPTTEQKYASGAIR